MSSKPSPVGQLLGWEVLELSKERCVSRLKIGEHCLQPYGLLHGGVTAAMAGPSAAMELALL
jgi:acyl-coenzyme A thioesterase PaaI-like protein